MEAKQFSIALNISCSMKTPDTKAAMRVAKMTNEELQSLEAFEKSVLGTVGNHTEWLTEKPTVKSMAEAIKTRSSAR